MLKDKKGRPVPVAIIVAMSKETRAIGNADELLWHIPEDLKRFKKITKNKPIILGRKTFQSILKILGKPLPDRSNIVVTRDPNYYHDNVKIVTSLKEAFATALAEEPTEIMVGGGGEIYQQTLPYADRLYLTLVDNSIKGDTFFPDISTEFTIEKEYSHQQFKGISYQWLDYKRK